MSIAAVHYSFFKFLKDKNVLSPATNILEIGEQNWYGDLDPKILLQDASDYSNGSIKEDLLKSISETIEHPSSSQSFDLAKIFYRIYFNTKKIRSIDLHGSNHAEELDLNIPHNLNEQFDSIFNLGTAEHIFNVYQVFKSMHEWLKVGGRFYHCLPMYGEIDHGFYNFHPTFFWDLAYANDYEVIIMAKMTMKDLVFSHDRASLSENILKQDKTNAYGLMVALEKTLEKPFQIPQQGRYDDNNPEVEDLTREWLNQRRDADL